MDVEEKNEINPGTHNGIPSDEEVRKMRPQIVNQEFVDIYNCDICHQLLIQPMQAQCGHRYCLDCITPLFKSAEGTSISKIRCPAEDCQVDIAPADSIEESENAIFQDFGAENDLQEMDVYCVFKPQGCKQQFKYSALAEHSLECSFRPMQCLSCNQRVLLGNLDSHSKTECPMRLVPCDYCGKSFQAAALVNHQRTECPNHLVLCPNGCGTPPMAEAKLEEHLKECKKLEGYCMFKDLGCDFNARMETDDQVKVDEESLATHETDHSREIFGKHLSYLVGACRQFRLENTNLRTQLLEMQQRNLTMKSQLDNFVHMMEDLKSSIEIQKVSMNERIQSIEARGTAASVQGGIGTGDSGVSQIKTAMDDLTRRLMDLERNPYQSSLGSGPSSHMPPSSLSYSSPGSAMGAGSGTQKIEEDLLNHSRTIGELDARVQTLETLSTNGVLIWKLDRWQTKLSESKAGRNLSLDSPSFYTSKYGYHMRARVYPNGDGTGRNSHVSLFFVLCRGHFDELLPWPFKQKVTFMILDQESGTRHICDTFRPDPQSQSFKKPSSDMNLASGCPLFVSHEMLTMSSRRYVFNDTLYVKVAVDTSDLFLP